MKKVLITGSNGFIGKNLLINLKFTEGIEVIEFDIESDRLFLEKALKEAHLIFHLAGINRPVNQDEFYEGNSGLTEFIVNSLLALRKTTPLILASSIQAEFDNPYGKSKLKAETHIIRYIDNGGEGYIYRLANVFGKWCRPNYNSVVATFCYNIANDLNINISDRNKELELIYVDDIIAEFKDLVSGQLINSQNTIRSVTPVYKIKLGELADKILSFKVSTSSGLIPQVGDDFTRRLHSTYLSYLPVEKANYFLETTVDVRGTLFEFIKSQSLGQIFVSKTRPGITRGNHFHHSKNEKFCVVSGNAVITLRHLITGEVKEFYVSGTKPEVVNILPGYTHSITNLGDDDLLTLFWANEPFDKKRPDTYHENVIK
jgi:UDP-2-acetamido-2,6-beta-L-arabino-hexul-4-ose reductase